jgi:hypothetical protein
LTSTVKAEDFQKEDSMMHLHDDLLELYLQGGLENEGLENAFMTEVESHLGLCKSCSDRLVEPALFTDQMAVFDHGQRASDGNERRRLTRIATDDPATIQQVGPFSPDRSSVRVLDISREGLRIHSSISLLPGAFVKIRLRRVIALGVVRYCVTTKNEFDLGVFLQDLFSVGSGPPGAPASSL